MTFKKPDIHKIAQALLRPFTRDLSVFVLFLSILLITPIIHFVSVAKMGASLPFTEIVAWLEATLFFAWVVTLIYSTFRKKVVMILILTILAVSAITDITCYVSMGDIYGEWVMETLLGTNLGEASEFMSEKTSPKPIIIIIISAWLCLSAFYLTRYLIKRKGVPGGRRYKLTWVIVMVLASAGTMAQYIVNPEMALVRSGFMNKIANILNISHYHDIVAANPDLETVTEERPANIVIIVGESMNRSHCHYAGYELPTTPRIEQLHADSLLYYFNNVDAADLHTIQCFKKFMGTNDSVGKDSLWYTQPTIIEVARLSDYQTLWLSNQSKTAVYDNLVTKFGHFCDEKVWLRGNTSSLNNRNTYDSELIPLLESYVGDGYEGNRLYFIHLMGSHAIFKYRFPEGFAKFTPADYSKYPEHQRSMRADYDNSILFTDYVVAELMKRFDGSPSVVFYFSDHGLDVYDTDEDFCEHSIIGNAESERVGREVPFVIYTTPEFRHQFPELTERIAGSTDRYLNTTDLIYTIMDIMGVKFASDNSVAEKTLLK